MSCHSMDAHDSFIAQDSASVRGDDLANSLLNFATGPDDLELQGVKRQKSARDPMSHRIIEKRRRDRMNNCLADLSRLIPTSYLKQGQGRIEKTEIIEMAIKHIKTLQAQVDSSQNVNYNMTSMKRDTGTSIEGGHMLEHSCCGDQFYQGFKECQDETLRYMVEGEAMVASDPFCVRVMDHLSNVAQRFDLSCIRGEDKKEVVMDVEGQQPMSGAPSFSGSSANTSLPSLEPMLPLLPSSGGMLMPASPVRNKQLRNLLSARALQQLEAEREACTPHNPDHKGSSGGEAGSTATSTALHPVLSVCSAPPMSMDTSASLGLGHCDNSMNGSGTSSSGYMSDTSAMDRFSNGSVMSSAGVGELMAHARDSSAVNAYKFKHSITKRFSQEGKAVAQQYDGSSSASSREAEDEHPHHSFLKQRATKTKNKYASSSDSGPYPTSDLSGATSVSSHESADGGALDRNGGRKVGVKGASDVHNPTDAECCSRSAMPLPGFVLHPSGTHYMPMSVCYSNIPDLYDSGKDPSFGPPVFHPISIPVHFRGPVISVPGSSIHNQNAIAVKSADSASASPKDTKGIKKLQG